MGADVTRLENACLTYTKTYTFTTRLNINTYISMLYEDTHGTQNSVELTLRVGSTPTSGTMLVASIASAATAQLARLGYRRGAD